MPSGSKEDRRRNDDRDEEKEKELKKSEDTVSGTEVMWGKRESG